MLRELLKPIRDLFSDVKRKAMMRLEYEGLHKAEAITTRGARFYKDPAGFAMDRYAYYVCYKCNKVGKKFNCWNIIDFCYIILNFWEYFWYCFSRILKWMWLYFLVNIMLNEDFSVYFCKYHVKWRCALIHIELWYDWLCRRTMGERPAVMNR